MAKDVDLSSKQWLDIVFEGKNKDFGAYEMRAQSAHRHTRAVIIVLAALAVILVLLILSLTGVFGSADEDSNAATEQELVSMASNGEDEMPEEEEVVYEKQPEEEIQMPEEVANEQQVTAIITVADDKFDESKQVKDQEDVKQNEAQFGAKDVTEGTNDLTKQTLKEEVIQEAPKKEEPEKVYNMAMVEQKPEFPGGEQAMYTWLGKNLTYPARAAEEGVSGRVVVQFDISKTGSIENVRVVRGRHEALDREAVRLVKSMPKWQPGRNNGQPVKVTYSLPVTFKLQE